jgi:pterin-4a-carbinolamine dehydratase
MKIKRFNESNSNSINSIKDEILDLLRDSFLDNDILVNVSLSPAYIPHGSIRDRQSIYIDIGNPERNKKRNEYISLKDKVDDLKRLSNWAKTENLILKKMSIFGILNVEGDTAVTRQIDIENIDSFDPNISLHYPKASEKYGFIQLIFENYGWQTSHRLNYGGDITNQIIQEYTFEDMNQMTNFISSSMKVFEGQNHHPHYFNWSGNKLFISLKTHSSDSITQKDLDVASKIDKLYYDIFKKI